MPSIYGGDQSARDYAPHMWILREGGNSSNDDDYTYVGNATVSYDDPKTKDSYHIGVTSLGELVGAVLLKRHRIYQGIPAEQIPEAAKKKLAKEGIQQISTLAGQVILGGLGIEVPGELEPLDFYKLFNGSGTERAAEVEKKQQWDVVAEELRQNLDIA
jgi:hypothetical protein